MNRDILQTAPEELPGGLAGEMEWDEQLRRNAGRMGAVPEGAISGMPEKLTPSERFEAHRVERHCV